MDIPRWAILNSYLSLPNCNENKIWVWKQVPCFIHFVDLPLSLIIQMAILRVYPHVQTNSNIILLATYPKNLRFYPILST